MSRFTHYNCIPELKRGVSIASASIWKYLNQFVRGLNSTNATYKYWFLQRVGLVITLPDPTRKTGTDIINRMCLSITLDLRCPPACRWISHGSICELSCTRTHAEEVFHVFPNSSGVLSVTPTGDLLKNSQLQVSYKREWIFKIASVLPTPSTELLPPILKHPPIRHCQLRFQDSSLSFQAKAQKRKRRSALGPLNAPQGRTDQNRPSSIFTRKEGASLPWKPALLFILLPPQWHLIHFNLSSTYNFLSVPG